MVDEITPTFYAVGKQLTYTLTGSGFDNLPNDVVGIRSVDNADPLAWRDTISPPRMYELTEKSDTRIVFSALFHDAYNNSGYLGGIVSNDRNHVFWVNNSQPLPANRGDSEIVENIEER